MAIVYYMVFMHYMPESPIVGVLNKCILLVAANLVNNMTVGIIFVIIVSLICCLVICCSEAAFVPANCGHCSCVCCDDQSGNFGTASYYKENYVSIKF